MNKRENWKRGTVAEERTLAFLDEKRGRVERVTDVKNPDLIWESDYSEMLAVEVKSVEGITKGKVGRITITKGQWENTIQYAEEKRYTPCVMVEIIVRASFRMYWMLTRKRVDDRMGKSSATFTVWEVVRDGILIGWEKGRRRT